ncbi:[acyl-carrier-protein] S-malonyltransferase [Thiogranum longum]|uniref:Malonyl CoA-acyl carrier protein transacylase n=2 Tax=Thiogranum longum TaxID=1537524 RepID=A0A4V2PGV5_9GAMM|nr:[acyl-carrier-protein] S-malonyltransferase [Thiogranum longum]
MVFPGQGSQSVGMLSALAEVYPQVGDTFAEASTVLGYDLWERVQNGPAEALNQTACTQPAMLTAGVATWRCWQAKTDALPAQMAGHSLGEYTALVCAGAMAFSDAVSLVEKRGEYMQNAVPAGVGAMAAILGLEDAQVEAVCAEAAQGEVVSAVNYNSPGQVVIAGNASAVERAMALAKAAGAKRALPLPVSVPSHCSLMQPAAGQLALQLSAIDIQSPSIPVIHNVDAASHADPATIRDALAAQLYRPVRWVDCVRGMQAKGADTLVEAGPGKVLAGLTKRIEKTLTAIPVQDADDLDKAIASIS